MMTRPQTLHGLVDSPAGLAAWMYDKFAAWTDTDGEPEKELARDEMLDDVTLSRLTNAAISSARPYWKNNASNVNQSTFHPRCRDFPGEIYYAPRSWTERAYHKPLFSRGRQRRSLRGMGTTGALC